MARLMGHKYRGNVRELENIIEQAVVMTRSDVIHEDDLPALLAAKAARPGDELPGFQMVNGDLPRLMETMEKKIILETLASFSGNKSSAARHLGLTESGLRYKLAKWSHSGSEE